MAVFRPFLTLLMAASVCTASVQTSREKRSDDPEPLATVVSTHSQQLNQLTAQLTALQNGFNHLQSQVSHHVAFHVRLSANNHAQLNKGQILKFDNILTNVGSTYNPVNGMFTSPVAGLYAFQFSTSSMEASSTGSVYLNLGGNHVVFIDTTTTMATGSGVFHMNQGDQAWIEGNTANVHVYSYDTTFTGFLVTAD